MKDNPSKFNADDWIIVIEKALKNKRVLIQGLEEFDKLEREIFARTLAEGLPAILNRSLLFASTASFKNIKKKLEKFIKLAGELKGLSLQDDGLSDSQKYAIAEVRRSGSHVDFEAIHNYGRKVWLYLDDLHAMVRTPNKNNLRELMVCQFLCNLYEKCLGAKPTYSSYDLSKESGDINDGTDYERVCRVVAKLADLQITWTTMKQAACTYKESSYLKRMHEHIEKYSILDQLPFE